MDPKRFSRLILKKLKTRDREHREDSEDESKAEGKEEKRETKTMPRPGFRWSANFNGSCHETNLSVMPAEVDLGKESLEECKKRSEDLMWLRSGSRSADVLLRSWSSPHYSLEEITLALLLIAKNFVSEDQRALVGLFLPDFVRLLRGNEAGTAEFLKALIYNLEETAIVFNIILSEATEPVFFESNERSTSTVGVHERAYLAKQLIGKVAMLIPSAENKTIKPTVQDLLSSLQSFLTKLFRFYNTIARAQPSRANDLFEQLLEIFSQAASFVGRGLKEADVMPVFRWGFRNYQLLLEFQLQRP